MAIAAVIWDLDGTLISTKRLYLEAYRRALAPYIGKVLTDEEILGYRSRSEIRFLKAVAREQFEASLRDFQQHYRTLHDTHFGGIYPGVPEVLAEIRARGLKQGIVTGKSRSSYEAGLATADLGPFDVLVMDDDVDEPKPHPQGILAAVKALGVDPGEAIYVGDSTSDMEAALQAGTFAAAALWSKEAMHRAWFLNAVQDRTIFLLEAPKALLDLL